MRTEDVYKTLAPEVVTTEMIDAARVNIEALLGVEPTFEQIKDLAELLLEVAQDYYRRGAFDMEHRTAAHCEAEDQGGWPCCRHPAEYFVEAKHMKPGEKRPVYCNQHRVFNRFYRADQMAPIYVNPAKAGTKGT
jgi:hypothetical protein